MKLSTQTERFASIFGYEDGVRRLCEIGYDCLDLTLTHLGKEDGDPLLQDNYREIALNMRKIAESYGVCFNQCHAPYHFKARDFIGDTAAREDITFRIGRAIEIAGLVGAKVIVIHPLHHRNYHSDSPEYFFGINMEFYGTFAQKAQECGVKIAVENMWQRSAHNNRIVSDVCSNPHELAQYVDELNKLYGGFVACLDIGHCALTGAIPAESIRVLGDRLQALHVHDNDTENDSHLLPFTGKIDFKSVMTALSQIGYTGELTFEADKFLKLFPTEHITAAAEFMHKTGRLLISIIEKE